MSVVEAARSPSPSSRHFQLKKVLILEPARDAGMAMVEALEQSGYYPNLVGHAVEGRRRVFERHYDLVILSTAIDRAARESVVREMLKHGNAPHVVLLAGMDEELDPLELESAPSLSVLRHPVTGDDLVEEVRARVGPPWPDDK